MDVIDLGLLSYQEAESLQLQKVAEVVEGSAPNTLLFCSHPACVTLGRSTDPSDITGWSGPIYKTSRGGRATYHGPSQMIVYPVINLAREYPGLRTKDLHHFLQFLSAVTSRALKDLYGLEAASAPAHPESFSSEDLYFTGVWAGDQKVASIGIAVKSWVSYHGLALNLYRDELAFQGIAPCGFSQKTMASLEHLLGQKISRQELQDKWSKVFEEMLMENRF